MDSEGSPTFDQYFIKCSSSAHRGPVLAHKLFHKQNVLFLLKSLCPVKYIYVIRPVLF